MTKSISLLLILSIFITSHSFLLAQTSSTYEATLIVKKADSATKKKVFISVENDNLNIIGKDKNVIKSFQKLELITADYTFSEKPQIAESIVVAVTLTWVLALPFLFTKKKKHWLVLATKDEAFLFDLKKENYRQLLFDMNSNGFKIKDSGNYDYEKPKTKNDKKATSPSKDSSKNSSN